MKPTEKQIKVINECISTLQFWKDSNDISSPTHYCDIEESLGSLYFEDIITQNESKHVSTALEELYNVIKRL